MSKPMLYTFGASVWSAPPELAVEELGWDVNTEVVNLANGENFKPSFLKINPNATLPTLNANGKVYTTTADVISYLVQNAPKSVGKSSGTGLIKRIHEDDVDPNFALLLSRSDDEKKARAAGTVLMLLSNRQKALEHHAASSEGAEHSEFYKAKIAGNGGILSIYNGSATAEATQQFYETSQQHWVQLRKFILEELPGYLPEHGFIGGERPGEDDFHVGAWLARIVATTGGKDVGALEAELGHPVPPKVIEYWNTWSVRDSWKKVYADGLH